MAKTKTKSTGTKAKGTDAPKAKRKPALHRNVERRLAEDAAADDADAAAEKDAADPQIPLDAPDAAAVTSQTSTPQATPPAAQEPGDPARSLTDMNLNKSTTPRKNDKLVIYNFADRKGSIQLPASLFGGIQNAPDTIELNATGIVEPRQPKAKETPEERKARLAALPKLTLEEKVARAEQRAAALREKLAKAANAQPQA